MSKLTLTPLASLDNKTSAISNINANSDLIETALDNTLSRDGTSPNAMSASIDMNSNRILNLLAPASDNEPATKAYVDSAAYAELPGGFTALSSFGQNLIDDVDAAAGRVTLGAAASGANTDITSVYLSNTGLKIKDTNATHGLTVAPGSNITADRTLTVTTGDADRTLDISAASVTITAAGAAILDDASAAAQRTTLGLGTMATQADSAVAITGGTIAGATITGGSVTGITDLTVADGGTGASTARAACANLGAHNVVLKSGSATTRTSVVAAGDATETALVLATVPAGAMGPNGALRITAIWNCSNTGSSKSLRIRLNGLAGTTYSLLTGNTGSFVQQAIIFNRNAQNSQIGSPANSGTSFSSLTAATTSAIDTSAAVDVAFTGAWGGATGAPETIKLEAYMVEVIYGA